MSDNTNQTRLAAILAADVVDYTRLVEEDTAATVEAWKTVRDNVLDPGVKRNSGRVIKLTGDGFIAEFPTVQSAVECAIELQLEIETNPLKFRMAVSVGDILDDGRDIHGEGVNIAARLEAIANPGGICVSGEVFNMVQNRVNESFVDLGAHKVKHVSSPVRVYAIQRFMQDQKDFADPQESTLESTTDVHVATRVVKRPGVMVAILVLLFSGTWFLYDRIDRLDQSSSGQGSHDDEAGLNDSTAGLSEESNALTRPPEPAETENDQTLIVKENSAIPTKQNSVTLSNEQYIIGQAFRDCDVCPLMIVVPGGTFTMGSTKGDVDEIPLHEVNISHDFAVSKFEVSFSEWDACVANGGCRAHHPNDMKWGRGNRPAIHISWSDAKAYVDWLSDRTDKKYRLLTEAEWEYAARSGTSSFYPWGPTLDAGKANYGYFRNKTLPVGSYDANKFGLYDMIGNVWEWVEDCYKKNAYASHRKYPEAVKGSEDCRHVLRGGSWDVDVSDGADLMRASIRNKASREGRYANFGARVAREID